MSPVSSDFLSLGPSVRTSVSLADNHVVPCLGEGTVPVMGHDGLVHITQVLFVPALSMRLLSVAAIYDNGGHVEWGEETTQLFGRDPRLALLECHRKGAGWFFSGSVPTMALAHPEPAHCLLCGQAAASTGSGPESVPATWELWHARLGHVNPQTLATMQRHQWVTGLQVDGEIPKVYACPGCLRGKMTQLPFPQPAYRATAPFERVHMDLMGKLEVPSARSKSRYMLLLKDEFTGYAWCFFLRKKKQAPASVQDFFALVERQHDTPIKGLRSDRGGEFLSVEFVRWLTARGVSHQLTAPYTPQQNGMCERANRTLTSKARSMLQAAGLPKRFWEHALRYSVWTTNRVPSRRLREHGSPYEALNGRRPDVSAAKVFGCLAHVWVPDTSKRRKMDSRADLGVFLGMAEDTKGWEFWLPDTGEVNRISRNAYFHERQFLRDADTLDASAAVPQPLADSLGDPFPEEQCLTSDPRRAREFLELPLWARATDPGRAPPEDALRPRRVRWWDEAGPSSSGPPHPDDDDEEDSSPSPTGPPGGPAGEGECSPPGLPSTRYEEEVHQGVGVVHPQVPPPVRQVVRDPDPPPGLPEAQEDPPSLSRPGSPGVPEHASGCEQSPHYPTSPESTGESQSEGEQHTPSSSETTSGDSDGHPEIITLQEVREPLARVYPRRERLPPMHFSPQVGGKRHHIYRRAGMAAVFLTSVPPQRWKVPKSVPEANRSEESERWLEARLTELQGLEDMSAWELVDPPKGANILRALWTFALKLNPDNTIERFKARLVCDGSRQKEGVDYEDTFASTAGRTTVRVFFAIAALLGWQVHQIDVSQAFLYGDVDRDVYMHQPPGHSDGTGRVCKLKRSLYGLKQAPRIWSEHLKRTLLSLGFTQSMMDPSLYFVQRDGVKLFVLDWVDDMLLGSTSPSVIDWCKREISSRYKVKDLGEASKYVGFWVHWEKEAGKVYLHQAYYCLELFEKFGDSTAKFPDTPLPDNFVLFHPWETLSPDGDFPAPDGATCVEEPLSPEDRKLYQRIVGSLNYAAHVTRIDIAYAVSQLSRATQKPRPRHLAAARRCVQYLAGTADWGLCYSKESGAFLEAWSDAGLGPSGTSSNMTGMILRFGGSPVSWMAKKQDRKTSSTTDSESLAVMTACQHIQHMRDVLAEFDQMQRWPTPLYNDNSACVSLCVEPRAHHKSVQLTRPMGMVRQLTHDGVISPAWVRTTEMPADFLTKRLAREDFFRCRDQSGFVPLPPHVSTLIPRPCGSARGSVGTPVPSTGSSE